MTHTTFSAVSADDGYNFVAGMFHLISPFFMYSVIVIVEHTIISDFHFKICLYAHIQINHPHKAFKMVLDQY